MTTELPGLPSPPELGASTLPAGTFDGTTVFIGTGQVLLRILLGLDGARRIRDGVKHATYAEIPTDLGHRAGRAAPETPEGDFIDQQIRAFLAKVE